MLSWLTLGVLSAPSEACAVVDNDCDSVWANHALNCSHLTSVGWDCSGCDCPGDPSPLPAAPSAPPPKVCTEGVQGTCDETWASHAFNCSYLTSVGWDCSGCDCLGDQSPPPPPPSQPPPPPPPSQPPPPPPPSCPNTCLGAPEYANDGQCDDGGPLSFSSVCAFGALCAGSNPLLTFSLSMAPALSPMSPSPHLIPKLT